MRFYAAGVGALLARIYPLLLTCLALGLVGYGVRGRWGMDLACLTVGVLLWLDLFVGDAIETMGRKR